ncbi:hypothetical protein [Leptospira idonii]|uniref:Uncharacterized protein n=1 Tax=Leptospira idonii TaxID=1193500 RepID=A0A4R9LXB4_9LEPT|nr:hypothetical protein [Leptospira idonii]TGN18943.1 hypothetical protein EHS15_11030 [Leptospira idonii]
MNRKIVSFFFVFFFFSRCSVYYLGDSPRPVLTGKIDKEVSYELVGWDGKENKDESAVFLEALHRSQRFKKISSYIKSDSEMKIQIILDSSSRNKLFFGEDPRPVSLMVEEKPGTYSLFLINRILAVQTALIIPILQKSDDQIMFRVWKKNRISGEYSYRMDSLQVFGWVSLLVRWNDDRKKMETYYTNLVYRFLEDSQGVFE